MTVVTLDGELARLGHDRPLHVIGPRPELADLEALEKDLGRAIPEGLRQFYLRFGGGLFYQFHEIHGPHPVFLHDIEIVAGLASVAVGATAERLPFHVADGVVHAVRPDGSVVALEGTQVTETHRYPTFAHFLAAVVVAR